MSMQGIDIASYQAGINIAALPIDFVIVKATQGTGYVNPDFTRAADQTLSCGKKLGVYHYIGGQGAAAEMKHFAEKFAPYKGKAVPCLDWESIQNSAWQNEGYLEQCIKEFVALTGIPPIVYASKSVFPWDVCARNNCGTWVAQYANNNTTGLQGSPWNEGSYNCTIRQYTSTLRLDGWGGNLDGNKAYIDAATWDKYANPSGVTVETPNRKTMDQLVQDVLNDVYGVNPHRAEQLTAEGYDAAAVQKAVNDYLNKQNTDSSVPAGTYTIQVNGLQVRTGASKQYPSVAHYDKGGTVKLDGWSAVADGWVWGRYIGASSGKYRYIAVRSADGKTVYAKR